MVILRWNERDGPEVEPPRHQGFGSRMIGRVLTAQIGAKATTEYRPDGLRIELEFPLTS